MERGIALYIAITVTGALLLVSFGIVELALKQVAISSAGRDSQEAFYAADSGGECAIYWDVKNPAGLGTSAFATSTGQPISCNADIANFANVAIVVAHSSYDSANKVGTSTFTVTFLPEPHCAKVNVVKSDVGGVLKTKIESKGYNTCDTASYRRVERAIRISY